MVNDVVLFSFFLLNIYPVSNDVFVIAAPPENNPKDYKIETTLQSPF